MKTKLVSYFLKREHIIFIIRSQIISQQTQLDEQQLLDIETKQQKEENRILLKERFQQVDLELLQTQLISIANLIFSYFKLHFPMNANLMIKDHIKILQNLKQISYGGVSLQEVFKMQRFRLSQERLKYIKGQKMAEESILPKIINYRMDASYLNELQDKYFHSRNSEHRQPYQILNLANIQYKRIQNSNKDLYQSITTVEDIPSLQSINTNLIQPILNFDSFNSQFEQKFNKIMSRNLQIMATIKKYHAIRKTINLPGERIKQRSSKSIKLKLDKEKINTITSQDQLIQEIINYKLAPKSVPNRNSQMVSPILANEKTEVSIETHSLQITHKQKSESEQEARKLNIRQKISVKPINYETMCVGEMKSPKQQGFYPKLKRELSQKDLVNFEEENDPNLNLQSVKSSVVNSSQLILPDIERLKKVKKLREIQQYIQVKRYHTSQDKEETTKIINQQIMIGSQSMRRSIPLLNRKNVNQQGENSLIQLQNQYPKSEQLLQSLIQAGALKSKQSEICDQFLQPIKIHSQMKLLTPKRRQELMSRSKFKKLQIETKLFNIK